MVHFSTVINKFLSLKFGDNFTCPLQTIKFEPLQQCVRDSGSKYPLSIYLPEFDTYIKISNKYIV